MQTKEMVGNLAGILVFRITPGNVLAVDHVI